MSSKPRPVALVTGGTRRIGAAIVRKLHERGLNLVIHYRGSAAPELLEELNARRADSAVGLAADLADLEQIKALAANSVAAWGSVQLLVNNASGFYPTAVDQASWEQWDDLFSSNVKGAFFLTQSLLPSLRETQGGVVNIVDIHAERPLPGHAVYSMAKAALQMMTRALALELGPLVRVNGVAPGAILWPQTDRAETPEMVAAQRSIIERTALKKTGSVEDIADAVAFLGLDAEYVTGQILAVDGGRTLNL